MSIRLDDSLRANLSSDFQTNDSLMAGSDLLAGLGERVLKGIAANEAQLRANQAIDSNEVKSYMSALGANVPGLKFSIIV